MTESSVAFARTEMLPQQEPPLSERGIVKWLHENLFSGWLNTILTLLGVVTVFLMVKAALPWLLNGVWVANSLGECRAVVAANAGPDAQGACWAMIRERWHQFLFGFYPMDQYWRPVLAFALMIVALAPVLYYGLRRINMLMIGIVGVLMVLALIGVGADAAHIILAAGILAAIFALAATAPTKLVWVTILFPAVGFFLLWGGSVWGPVFVVASLVVVTLAFTKTASASGLALATLAAVLTFVFFFLNPFRLGESFLSTVLYIASFGNLDLDLSTRIGVGGFDLTELFPLHSAMSSFVASKLPWGLPSVDSDQFGGFLLAFVIGVTAIAASLPIGILLALGRRSDMLLVKTLSVGFIEFIRGVPLITMLFVASLLLQYFLPPQTNFDLILRVIILVTLFASAYIAEVIRGGLAALPRGQYEAADALGLDYWQAQRLIIMPQALKISIPGIVSSFIGLFKDTTLVALVGLADPLQGITKIVRADINWKGIYWEPILFVGAIFFIVCFSMSRYSMYLERKLKRDHR
jgi:general L-amino acid transport system permease protein